MDRIGRGDDSVLTPRRPRRSSSCSIPSIQSCRSPFSSILPLSAVSV